VSISGVADNLPPGSSAGGYPIQVTLESIQQSYTLTASGGGEQVTQTLYLQTGQVSAITVPSASQSDALHGPIALNADGSWLAAGNSQGVLVLQLQSFTAASSIISITTSPACPNSLAFTADQSLLFILTGSGDDTKTGILMVYETSTWTQLASVDVPFEPMNMVIAADGSWVVVEPYPLQSWAPSFRVCAVYLFSNTANTFTVVATDAAPPGILQSSAYAAVAGGTPDGNIFVVGKDDAENLVNLEYSVAGDPSAPFTLLSTLPLPARQPDPLMPNAFRTFPGSPVLLQQYSDPQGNSFLILCDSTSFAQVINPVLVSSAGKTFVSFGAIALNPLCFYAMISETQIGVFGPAGYSSSPAVPEPVQ
jgi:hypothetical protein